MLFAIFSFYGFCRLLLLSSPWLLLLPPFFFHYFISRSKCSFSNARTISGISILVWKMLIDFGANWICTHNSTKTLSHIHNKKERTHQQNIHYRRHTEKFLTISLLVFVSSALFLLLLFFFSFVAFARLVFMFCSGCARLPNSLRVDFEICHKQKKQMFAQNCWAPEMWATNISKEEK